MSGAVLASWTDSGFPVRLFRFPMLTLFRFRLPAAARLFFMRLVIVLAAPGAAWGQRVVDTRAGQPLTGLPFWKWQSPTPQGYRLNDLHAFTDSAVLAVGQHGLGLRTANGGRTWQPVGFGTAANLMSIAFATPQVGWVIGNTAATNDQQLNGLGVGEVRTTLDGGATWTTQPFGETFSVQMQRVQAPSATAVFVLYQWTRLSNGFILSESRLRRSQNGGSTWVRLTLPSTLLADAVFPTPTLGLVGGPYGLFRTTDAGATWQDVSAGVPGLYVSALNFEDPLHGWVGGARSTPGDGGPVLFRTTDGGLTWAPVVLNNLGPSAVINTIRFAADHLHGLLYEASSHNYWLTTDGGLTWQPLPAATSSWASPAVRVLPQSGAVWLQMADTDLRTAPSLADSLRRVYTTTASFTGGANLREAVFPEPGTGWLAPAAQFVPGAFWPWDAGPQVNTLWRTTDRGDHWRALPLDTLAAGLVAWAPPGGRTFLTASAFPDRDTAYVAGLEAQDTPQRRAFVLRTTDGGRTWQRLPLPATSGAPLRMRFQDGRRGLIVGDTNATFLTTDGGLTWQRPAISAHRLYTCGWVDAQHAYAGGDTLNLAVSADGGQSWRTVTFDSTGFLNYPYPPGPSGLTHVDTRNLYFFSPTQGYRWGGNYANIQLTTNGGTTWLSPLRWTAPPGIPLDTEIPPNTQQVVFRTRQEGYAFGSQQLRTLDGGRTWTMWAETATDTQVGALVDRYNAFAVGGGAVLRYSEKLIRTDTALVRTTFCVGAGAADSVAVPFTTEGTFAPAEQDFRVELSNAKGRFRPGQTLLVGRAAASPLWARLPATLPAGTYRLRVIRADSTVLGLDNGVDLLVTRRPTAVAIAPADSVAICAGDSVQLTAPAGFGVYQWSSGSATAAIWVRAAGAYAVRVGAAAGCLSPASDSVRVRVKPVPPLPVITAALQPSGLVILTSSAATGNQWLLNGQPIAGATSATYTVSTSAQNGAYTVQVTRAGCASPVSAAVPIGVSGTAADADAAAVSVLPNPARGHLTVRAAGGAALARVTLTDLSGRRVAVQVARETGERADVGLSLVGVAAGTYLLHAELTTGRVTTHRLVVEQ